MYTGQKEIAQERGGKATEQSSKLKGWGPSRGGAVEYSSEARQDNDKFNFSGLDCS